MAIQGEVRTPPRVPAPRPSESSADERPTTNATALVSRAGIPMLLPSSSVVRYAAYMGTRGRMQGEKNESSPAAKTETR